MEETDYGRLESIVEQPPVLDEGSHLYRTGDSLTAVYAVRAGAFKTYAFDSGGREHVLGFVLAGELLGFDGVYGRRYGCNAVAVQESGVCALPYHDLAFLMRSATNLREQMLRLASRGFADPTINSSLAPEARLARFLIDISRRSRNGDAAGTFEFPMPLRDIAGYLRVATQDLDSLFSYFKREDIISVSGSRVRFRDTDRLNRIAQ